MKLLRFSSLAFRPSVWTFGAKIAAAEMGLCAYFLPHRRGVKFFLHVCLAYSVVAVSVVRASFLVRVSALRVSCRCGTLVFS